MKESTLWTAFEQQGHRTFPEAVILGDSAYACNNRLIPPSRGDVEGARHRFNKAHKKTRCTIERAYGVLKKRFYALKTRMRVRNMKRAAELDQCSVILHNICILFSDNGDDLLDDGRNLAFSFPGITSRQCQLVQRIIEHNDNFIICWVSSRSGSPVLGKGWCHSMGFWVSGSNMGFLFRYTTLGPELVYKIGILDLQHTIALFPLLKLVFVLSNSHPGLVRLHV